MTMHLATSDVLPGYMSSGALIAAKRDGRDVPPFEDIMRRDRIASAMRRAPDNVRRLARWLGVPFDRLTMSWELVDDVYEATHG